jgi:hypothetical protein
MSDRCKFVCILGILWAVWLPPYLWYRDAKDQQYRQLRGVAVTMQGIPPAGLGTNDLVELWQMHGAHIARLAQAERSRKSAFDLIGWISSGFILVLSVCLLSTGQKKREPNARPDASTNSGPAASPSTAGAGEGPPSVS